LRGHSDLARQELLDSARICWRATCSTARIMMKLLVLPALFTACVAGPDLTTSSTDQDLSAKHSCPANVPAALAPAADQDLAFSLDAIGTQNYVCAATTTGYAWTFVAPEAQLFRDRHECHHDEAIVHHFAGPTWQSLDDGSSVVGTKVAASTVDTTAIPWLLLTAASHDRGRARAEHGLRCDHRRCDRGCPLHGDVHVLSHADPRSQRPLRRLIRVRLR
jgi:hypothetical protein